MRNIYNENTVNSFRLKTDAMFTDEKMECKFSGIVDWMYKFTTERQLMDSVLWARFVEQFRSKGDINGGWRGEYWGKMMRGAAWVYSYTRDPELYKVLRESVEDMLTTAEEDGRVSSYGREKEFFSWDMWSRKYVLLALQYFMEVSGDEELNARIVKFMCGLLDYIIERIGDKKEGKLEINEATNNWRGLNSSSILEPVVRLYMLTGKQEYFDFATYIVNRGGTSIASLVDLAIEDTTDPYQYPITKAYEMISFFEGVLEYYRVTGDKKYKTAVVNFARRVADSEIVITGGSGYTHEYFDHGAMRQWDTPICDVMLETCVTVTWMKFCHQIIMLTGDVKYAELFETALYNAYLGAFNTNDTVQTKIVSEHYKNPDAVMEALPFDSYSSTLPDYRGQGIGGYQFMADKHYYGCCACIASAGIGTALRIATMLYEKGVALNLFIPGTVKTQTPEGRDVTLITDTTYPVGDKVAISVNTDKAEKFEIALRIPSWSENTTVTVNGEAVAVTRPQTVIDRVWQAGDKIEISLDMRTRLHRPVSNPEDFVFVDIKWSQHYVVGRKWFESPTAMYHAALTRGPIVLATDGRLGLDVDAPVDILDDDGIVNATPSDEHDILKQCEFKIPTKDGGSFNVIDYGHAGRDWGVKYAAWLPTKTK